LELLEDSAASGAPSTSLVHIDQPCMAHAWAASAPMLPGSSVGAPPPDDVVGPDLPGRPRLACLLPGHLCLGHRPLRRPCGPRPPRHPRLHCRMPRLCQPHLPRIMCLL
jgi:hypothetical protein